MADDARELIRYHAEGKVGVITIDRPEKRNAMTYAMLGEFIETVGRADDDPATTVLVITGVPGAFCAGTDLADLATVPGEVRGLRGSAEERHKWWPIAQARKPTIGAIDGPAVGMGAEFSSQCDLRLASTNARFAWNFVHRGLVPDTGAGHLAAAADHRRPAGAQAAVHRRDDRRRRGPPPRLRPRRRVERRRAPAGDGVGEHDRRRIAAQPRV